MDANTCFILYSVFVTYSKAVENLIEDLKAPIERPVTEIYPKGEVTTNNCSENEHFVTCKSCEKRCDGYNISCMEPCQSGCFCNLFRDKDEKCVTYENCSKNQKENQSSLQIVCGPHKKFSSCRNCERSCSNPNPSCIGPCYSGCFCADGLLLAPDGRCVKFENCPKEEISKEVFFGHEVSIEECAPDEVFVLCGWCEGSCSAPTPDCAPACTRGCLCVPPLLRHHSGHCVLEEDCKPHKCQSVNEEYVCKYGCERRCESRVCARTRRCTLGCHCRLGLLRDNDGKCVKPEECSNYD